MTTDVLFEVVHGCKGGGVGVMTLNRPQALNALNHAMILAMQRQLTIWSTDEAVKAVVVRAMPGRAFCAGGDLRAAYECHLANQPLINFFHDEYQLNRTIFYYPKPYLSLLDGITMGGGAGISINGAYRIGTERLLFAMPETGIGFFPDVGGTYFLPRLPQRLGFYLGLVGARLGSDDCVQVGLAHYKVSADQLSNMIQQLADSLSEPPFEPIIEQVLHSFSIPIQPSTFLESFPILSSCFSKETIERIMETLQQTHHAICQESVRELSKKSPTSLKVTLKALQKGSQLDFNACMKQEEHLTARFIAAHDFMEGIRAVIIDKDYTPHWRPNTLSAVSVEMVEKYLT